MSGNGIQAETHSDDLFYEEIKREWKCISLGISEELSLVNKYDTRYEQLINMLVFNQSEWLCVHLEDITIDDAKKIVCGFMDSHVFSEWKTEKELYNERSRNAPTIFSSFEVFV